MNVNRFDPFRDRFALRDFMNRVFEESAPQGAPDQREAAQRAWQPPVDVLENEEAFVVRLDVPGVNRDEIDIQIQGEGLVIRGNRAFTPEQGKEHYLRVERVSGPFQRSFTLGVPVNTEKVGASYRDGVLTVTLPKADQVKPRKVQINTDTP
jgi:HSP20 family protein